MAAGQSVKGTGRGASLTDSLVELISRFSLDQLPAGLIDKAKMALADTLGEALAAARLSHPPTRVLAAFIDKAAGAGASSLIGRGRGGSVADAALFNSALSAFGLNDPIHAATTMHAPAVAAAAAIAAGEEADASGRTVLEAFILGVEVACRVSAALDPAAVYRRQFHPSGVCGTFGAAVAAGHAFGLSPEAMASALGLALQQACGSLAWTTDTSESSRPLSPGFAARNGATAAELARLGFGGPPNPFDGKRSVFHAFSGRPRSEELLAGWGSRFYLMEMTHKLHASCSYTHAALDAVLGFMKEDGVTPAEITEVVVRVPGSTRALITDPSLRSCYAPYILAVALTSGRVTIDDIIIDRTVDPTISRIANVVRIVDDADLEKAYPERCAAIVQLSRGNGPSLERRVDAAKGTPENPLSKSELKSKFATAAAAAMSAGDTAALFDQIDRLEDVERIASVTELLRRTPSKEGKG